LQFKNKINISNNNKDVLLGCKNKEFEVMLAKHSTPLRNGKLYMAYGSYA